MQKLFFYKILSFLLLICMCVSFTNSAEAEERFLRPNWVKITSRTSLIRNEDVTNIKHPDYYRVQVAITYKNESRDKIITRIFNKTLETHIQMGSYQFNSQKRLGFRYLPALEGTLTSSRVNKVELYPGQSLTLVYFPSIKNLMSSLAKDTYGHDVEALNKNLKIVRVKLRRWKHGFQVKSEPI